MTDASISSSGTQTSSLVIAKAKELHAYLEQSGIKPTAQSANQLRKVIDQAPTPASLVTGVRIVAEAVRDYHVVRQQEETKRAEIASQTAVRLQELDLSRELLAQYLDRSFDERRDNFVRLFDALDRAQAEGDQTSMSAALDGILALAKSSPFLSLAEARRRMAQGDYEVEL
ncbi:hypothetical protein RDMS_12395 [Deinococcus sp. RL]|uniref:hypothetical protein n=1 Tax=Deinococcus sp. RL TaxID=1489678 RepID=UPI0004DA9943|nr:hypothetical protein [Deinococcus sp. RL]KEF33472.1 hypothetical protein RDMS_12395 [Deinococcus sp. RL]